MRDDDGRNPVELEGLGATARLARFCSTVGALSHPPEVYEKAAMAVLDAIGLAVSALDEKTTVAVGGLAVTSDQPGGARLWGRSRRTSLSDSVLVNATGVHAHFNDDSDLSSWTHPGGLIIPVALGACEAHDLSLLDVLHAVIAGYSSLCWLGADQEVALSLIHKGIRTTPTLGAIGAAAAGAAALRLTFDQAVSAIGIATSMAGGLLEPVRVGSDEWRIQSANAARTGLLAAQLAQQGVRGASEALEGGAGLLRAYGDLAAVPAAWRRDPDAKAMLAVVAKPFATLGDNMAAVIAAQLVHRGGRDIKQARRIKVRIWEEYRNYPGTSYTGPFLHGGQAQASTMFSVSAMLVYGRLDYDIPEQKRDDPAIAALMQKMSIDIYPDGGPFDGSVEVEFDDGGSLKKEASEAERTLLFHDRPLSLRLFRDRMANASLADGAPNGSDLFDLDKARSVPVRRWLDTLGL
jgi:2-methylcitrate dehydratase PrpD